MVLFGYCGQDLTINGNSVTVYQMLLMFNLFLVCSHKFLTEALLMKEEFSPTIDYVKPAIDAIILSARGQLPP